MNLVVFKSLSVEWATPTEVYNKLDSEFGFTFAPCPRWFHDLVLPNATEIRFIKGRLKFGNATTGAPFPSMVVVFDNTRHIKTTT